METEADKPFDDVTLLAEPVIARTVDLGEYRLVSGHRGELGLPVEAFLRLYVIRDGRVIRQIRSPGDLTGFVDAVSSAEEALAFVCLFTDPATVHFFERAELTIDVGLASSTQARGLGQLEPVAGRALGVSEPRVRQEGAGFVIERELVSAASVGSRRKLIRRTESVSRRGEYEHLGDELLDELEPGSVLMPFVE